MLELARQAWWLWRWQSREPRTQEKALRALAAHRDPRIARALILGLAGRDDADRRRTIEALRSLPADDAQATEGYRLALAPADIHTSNGVATILGEIGDPRAVDPLLERLANPHANPTVVTDRRLAGLLEALIATLEQLGAADERIDDALIQALEDAELGFGVDLTWRTRKLAAQILGRRGSRAAVEALERRREAETDPRPRQAIEEALRGL